MTDMTNMSGIKCQDCDREMSMATNVSNEGWVLFSDGTALCPVCVRLASCEKAVRDIQDMLIRAGVKRKTALETVRQLPVIDDPKISEALKGVGL